MPSFCPTCATASNRSQSSKPNKTTRSATLRFSTSVRHTHPVETYGVKFRKGPRTTIAFLVDTQYFEGLARAYEGAEVLVVNVVLERPHPTRAIMHLSLDDAAAVIRAVRPRKAVLTHFGMTMLRARPRELAERLTRELGVVVVAASDGMTLELDGD